MPSEAQLAFLSQFEKGEESNNKRQQFIADIESKQESAPAPNAAPQEDFTFGGTIQGEIETAMALASGAAALPLSGAVGLAVGAYGFVNGDDNQLDMMTSTMERIQNDLTYIPKTAEGQFISGAIAEPFQYIEEKKHAMGEWVSETTGSPELGAMAYALPDALLMFVGSNPFRARKMQLEANKVQAKAAELGIDLNETKVIQHEQMSNAARDIGGAIKGESSKQVVNALQHAKKTSDGMLNKIWTAAKEKGAGVLNTELAETLAPMMAESIRLFDHKDMKVVTNRLDELTEMSNKPWRASTIRELEDWRIKINKNMDKANKPEVAALNAMKGVYDKFMREQEINGLLLGDKTAYKTYALAIQSRIAAGKKFDDNPIVMSLIEKKNNVHEVRTLIFGSGKSSFRDSAGSVVQEIKNIIGAKSPAMKALQNDGMLNILEPLFDSPPKVNTFIQNYTNASRKNNLAVKELFTNTQLKDLDVFAKAIQKVGTDSPRVLGGLSQFIARMWVGHGIAKGAARVGIAKGLLDVIGIAAGTSTRIKIVQEVLGYNPLMPVFSPVVPVKGATLQAGNLDDG